MRKSFGYVETADIQHAPCAVSLVSLTARIVFSRGLATSAACTRSHSQTSNRIRLLRHVPGCVLHAQRILRASATCGSNGRKMSSTCDNSGRNTKDCRCEKKSFKTDTLELGSKTRDTSETMLWDSKKAHTTRSRPVA